MAESLFENFVAVFSLFFLLQPWYRCLSPGFQWSSSRWKCSLAPLVGASHVEQRWQKCRVSQHRGDQVRVVFVRFCENCFLRQLFYVQGSEDWEVINETLLPVVPSLVIYVEGVHSLLSLFHLAICSVVVFLRTLPFIFRLSIYLLVVLKQTWIKSCQLIRVRNSCKEKFSDVNTCSYVHPYIVSFLSCPLSLRACQTSRSLPIVAFSIRGWLKSWILGCLASAKMSNPGFLLSARVSLQCASCQTGLEALECWWCFRWAILFAIWTTVTLAYTH